MFWLTVEDWCDAIIECIFWADLLNFKCATFLDTVFPINTTFWTIYWITIVLREANRIKWE